MFTPDSQTMLMDLFHDTIPGLDSEFRCKRVHYHDFMQDVHKRMHEAKKAAPPRDVSRLTIEYYILFNI